MMMMMAVHSHLKDHELSAHKIGMNKSHEHFNDSELCPQFLSKIDFHFSDSIDSSIRRTVLWIETAQNRTADQFCPVVHSLFAAAVAGHPNHVPNKPFISFCWGVRFRWTYFLLRVLAGLATLLCIYICIYIKTMIVSRLHKCPLIFFNEILYKYQKSSNFFCEDRIG